MMESIELVSFILTTIVVHNAMVLTSRDFLTNYHPTAVYTCSDEISLLFMPGDQLWNLRTTKLCSILSSFASAKFNHYLAAQVIPEQTPPQVCQSFFMLNSSRFGNEWLVALHTSMPEHFRFLQKQILWYAFIESLILSFGRNTSDGELLI